MRTRRGWALGAALGAAALWMAPAPPASAAVAPLASCSFRFGPITETGAAGTRLFVMSLDPISIGQSCTTTAPVVVTMAPAATGLSYTDISGNPFTFTQAITFTPGRAAPQLVAAWSGFGCADPAVPGTLSFSSGGQRASTSVAPTSCASVGPGATASLRVDLFPTTSFVGIAPSTDGHGYWITDQYTNVTNRGDATGYIQDFFSTFNIVGIAASATGGYWLVSSAGGVFSVGPAAFYGSLGGVTPAAPIVGMVATADGHGYWLVGADGGVFAFGDAHYYGSLGGTHLAGAIVGMAATADGHGYWLAGRDGGVFAYGDAVFAGSEGSALLAAPIVGMASSAHGGYWLVAADGGVFTFGGAAFKGSAGGLPLVASISAMAPTPDGGGYWLLAADGGVFAYGDAAYLGGG